MKYHASPNLLMEALACLGRCANGNTWARMEEQLRLRNIQPTPAFSQALDRLKSLTLRLDPQAILKSTGTTADFQNMEGFPKNTVGTASPAFLVFYGLLERWNGDLGALEDYVTGLSPEQISYHLALALDLAEEYPGGAIPTPVFLDMVLGLSLPDGCKITILNILRDLPGCFRRMQPPVKLLLDRLSRETGAMEELCRILEEKLEAEGCAAYLARTTHLAPGEDSRYLLRPFLFGMDTTLSSQIPGAEICIYSGILRDEMLEMLSLHSTVRDSVYEVLRLLGDRTRFDLICYLRDHEAYGQELSARFGLSRNTIHHHMSKLSATGLVRCTASGSRIYYALDQDMARRLLGQQRELFCPDTQEQ